MRVYIKIDLKIAYIKTLEIYIVNVFLIFYELNSKSS
jgi:hypothetical protein